MVRDAWEWDRIEEWVVVYSSNKTLRQIAEMSGELECFGHRPCSYEKVRERAKEGLWLEKRTQRQAEQHSGILDDYRASYRIITDAIKDGSRRKMLDPSALSSLCTVQLKYGSEIMQINPPAVHNAAEVLTPDDVKALIRDVLAEEGPAFAEDKLVDMLAKETPASAEPNADTGANSLSA